MYFYDESGFSLDSNIPYMWSPINKPIKIPANRFAKRINVLGFLNVSNKDLFYRTTTDKVDTKVVISLFDDFSNKISKTTIIVLDNASIHRSKLFKENITKWESKGMYLLYLPTYSPELNLIEILWREMKYKWFKLKAYESFDTLKVHIDCLLSNFGGMYDINFG